MSPVPENSIFLVIDELLGKASRASLSEFEMARLRRYALEIMDEHPALSRSVLGSIACLEGDEARARKEHEISLKIAPGIADLNSNYAATLARFRKVDEAVKHQLRAVELAPENLKALGTLLEFAYHTNNHGIMEAWLPEFRKRAGHPHEVEAFLAEDAEDIRAIESAQPEEMEFVPWEKLKAELGL